MPNNMVMEAKRALSVSLPFCDKQARISHLQAVKILHFLHIGITWTSVNSSLTDFQINRNFKLSLENVDLWDFHTLEYQQTWY